ncbi:MAG: acetate--CoA ligase [Verrucomicrobiota bacterium]
MSKITAIQKAYKPNREFVKQATINSKKEYEALYHESIQSPQRFWKKMASELDWFDRWKKLCQWELPFSKWFIGGKLNASYNCLDRHVKSGRRNKAAIIWEGEPGEQQTITYQQLLIHVSKFCHALKRDGLRKGERVAIYMPMIPEAVIAILACARMGCPHTVVFGGFSQEALKERINDCGATYVITADGGWRRGKIIELKKTVDVAVAACPKVRKVVVVERCKNGITMGKKDKWYHEMVEGMPDFFEAPALDSEHPLFILYTSGSTGKPKGILHTTAGYLLGVYLTTKYVFDLKESDIYWCTADIGWVTGHSYVVYGCLSNGGTSLIYEGAPNYPEKDRFWDIVERHKVDVFYTAPTAIRAFEQWGDEHVTKHDLSSLRLLGSVGEPINPDAWLWYHKVVGQERCPIVDTWWQTETGSHMLTTLPGATSGKPGWAGLPFFGVDIAVVDDAGKEVKIGEQGKLVIRKPWPSMLRTIYGDKARYKKQYWQEVEGCYFTGDSAVRDKEGYFRVLGRMDDVLNVSGHRLGTAEVEAALDSHPDVVEAAVVGRPDPIKGQGIVAFITLRSSKKPSEELKTILQKHVAQIIGSFAKPDVIRFSNALPKTRSGKIMRRLLKEIATTGDVKGDVTTLEDFSVVAKLMQTNEK